MHKAADSNVRVREARAADAANVQRLLTALELPVDGVPESLAHFHIATDGDRIIGVAGLELADCDAALLRSVAVDERYRGIGVAGQLVDRVVADAQSNGIQNLYLLTTTASEYFARKGFHVSERSSVPDPLRETAEFKGACPASATVMVMRLSAPETAVGEQL